MAAATITIKKNRRDGTVQTTVEGVAGAKCTDITHVFESAMGSTISSVPTREMHEIEQEVVVQDN
jgi:hypothetical protein